MAKLYFRYGAMNSGKSTALMQVAHNYEERGMKVVVIKPRIDTKAKDKISSRIGIDRQVDHLIDKNEDVRDYIYKLDNVKCVLVDEVQFLSSKQIDQLLFVTIEKDIPVICYGIRTDFKLNGFEGSTRLLEIAHSIEEMKAVCKCGRKALFNARIINGEFVFSGNQVAIDGNDEVTYESLCPKCYFEELEKKNEKIKVRCKL